MGDLDYWLRLIEQKDHEEPEMDLQSQWAWIEKAVDDAWERNRLT